MTTMLLLTTLLLCLASAFACPDGCECLPLHRSQLRIDCRWKSLNGTTPDSIGLDRVRSLVIRCTSNEIADDPSLPLLNAFKSLRSLQLHSCRLADDSLAAASFSGFGQLRSLVIRDYERLSIEEDTLRALSQLDTLEVANAGLRSLPDLCGLNELKLLNVSHNLLTDMPSLKCSSQVVIVDASHNSLSALPSMDWPQLDRMDLSHNDLTVVAASSDAKPLNRLRTLNLKSNFITQFSLNLTTLLPSLQTLDLSNNELSAYPRSLAASFTLHSLNLSHNHLTATAQPLALPSLTSLDLSNNRLAALQADHFNATPSLVELYLQQNKLSDLPDYVFRGLSQLHLLNLANNEFTAIGHAAFSKLSSLRVLVLRHNQLVDLARDFFAGMQNVAELDVSHNKLTSLPSGISHSCEHLTDLQLQGNAITELQTFVLERFATLRRINISHNDLTRIGRYVIENLPALEELDLSNNKINQLEPNSFNKLPKLKRVHLQKNRIQDIQGPFSNLVSLKYLNLQDNELVHLDSYMLPVSLEVMHVSNNQITHLTNHSGWRLQLLHLDMSYNLLPTLAENVLPPTIVTANFSHNQIVDVSNDTLARKDSLQWLDLRYNNIEVVNATAVRVSSAATPDLYLAHNPLRCTCNLDWVKAVQAGQGESAGLPRLPDLHNLQCRDAVDDSLPPVSITFVAKKRFLCSYDQYCHSSCDCCIYQGCYCNSVCPAGCSCYRDTTMAQNIVRCSNNPLIGADFDFQNTIPLDATTIYLDGTARATIRRHDFLNRHSLRELYLNNSGVLQIEPNAFRNLRDLHTLDLSNNRIAELSSDAFFNVKSMQHLFLSHNQISKVDASFLTAFPELRALTLNGNQLSELPETVATAVSTNEDLTLLLGENPWHCDCADRFLLQSWLPPHVAHVQDYQSLYCYDNLTAGNSTVLQLLPSVNSAMDSIVKVNFWTFIKDVRANLCGEHELPVVVHGNISGYELPYDTSSTVSAVPPFSFLQQRNIILTAVVVSSVTLFLVLVLVAWRCRMLNRMRGYQAAKSHSSALPSIVSMAHSPISDTSSAYSSCKRPLLDDNTLDALVIYSCEDASWVEKSLADELEKQHPYYRISLIHRDIDGVSALSRSSSHAINDGLCAAVRQAQRVVLIVSNKFLQREARQAHVRTAITMAVKQERVRLVTVLTADARRGDIDPELGQMLRTSTQLQADDVMFWDRLRDALPNRDSVHSPLNQTGSTTYSIVPSELV